MNSILQSLTYLASSSCYWFIGFPYLHCNSSPASHCIWTLSRQRVYRVSIPNTQIYSQGQWCKSKGHVWTCGQRQSYRKLVSEMSRTLTILSKLEIWRPLLLAKGPSDPHKVYLQGCAWQSIFQRGGLGEHPSFLCISMIILVQVSMMHESTMHVSTINVSIMHAYLMRLSMIHVSMMHVSMIQDPDASDVWMMLTYVWVMYRVIRVWKT